MSMSGRLSVHEGGHSRLDSDCMQVQLFLEEMFSVVLTPYILYFIMPLCVVDIVDFVAHNTVEVEGVGAVCSLAVFDLTRHGNTKYGSSPGSDSSKKCRSRQGKVEKSLLTFIATYPTWEPPVGASALLSNMDRYRSPSRSIYLV